jgi:hypothetical protein
MQMMRDSVILSLSVNVRVIPSSLRETYKSEDGP